MTNDNLHFSTDWEFIAQFLPGSAGHLRDKQIQSLKTIHNLLPSLLRVSEISSNKSLFQLCEYKNLTISPKSREKANLLRSLFDELGSDKGSYHSYYLLYAKVLSYLKWKPDVLIEIGIGSTNENIISNMGVSGKPGASLLTWQKFLPYTKIIGADIDPSILGKLPQIDTFWVDQTNYDSFAKMGVGSAIESGLIIDDGLHSMDANLNTVSFGLSKIKKRGFLIIEDIPDSNLELWKIVGQLLSPKYRTTFIRFPISNICMIRQKNNKFTLT